MRTQHRSLRWSSRRSCSLAPRLRRQRDCHSAAPPSTLSRCINSDGGRERQQNDSLVSMAGPAARLAVADRAVCVKCARDAMVVQPAGVDVGEAVILLTFC